MRRKKLFIVLTHTAIASFVLHLFHCQMQFHLWESCALAPVEAHKMLSLMLKCTVFALLIASAAGNSNSHTNLLKCLVTLMSRDTLKRHCRTGATNQSCKAANSEGSRIWPRKWWWWWKRMHPRALGLAGEISHFPSVSHFCWLGSTVSPLLAVNGVSPLFSPQILVFAIILLAHTHNSKCHSS